MGLFRKFDKGLAPLEESYSESELSLLSKKGTIIDLAPGQTLFEEGTIGTEAAVIISGTAKVSHGGKTVAILEAGNVIGESALLSGSIRNASVCSVTMLKIAVINKESMLTMLNECEDFRVRIDSALDSRAA